MFFALSADSLVVGNEREDVRNILAKAVREFERHAQNRGVIRQCKQESPDLFLEEGLRVLIHGDASAGYRFLAVILVNEPAVFLKLTDRWRFTREDALKVARQFQRIDQNFDTKLTSLLPGRDDTDRPFALQGEHAERALELLDEISPGRRIVPIMRHLTDHPDPKISAKAALLIGKRVQNLAWARRVVAVSTEPRLRANAVETMWGISGQEVIELFRECLGDWDNRVVGNAIIGLHKAGDPETLRLVQEIASDENPKLRMTAAWAMGEIGDPRFVSVLAPLVKDRQAEVRRAALRSLKNFHTVKLAKQMAEPEAAFEKPEEPKTAPVPATESQAPRQFWG